MMGMPMAGGYLPPTGMPAPVGGSYMPGVVYPTQTSMTMQQQQLFLDKTFHLLLPSLNNSTSTSSMMINLPSLN